MLSVVPLLIFLSITSTDVSEILTQSVALFPKEVSVVDFLGLMIMALNEGFEEVNPVTGSKKHGGELYV